MTVRISGIQTLAAALIALLSAGTTEAGSNVCCHPDGTCNTGSCGGGESCDSGTGVCVSGLGSCDDCPPVGACCDSGGTCSITQSGDCTGGTYQGDASECDPNSCPFCGDGSCDASESDVSSFCAEDCGCAASTCEDDLASPGGCYCDCECLSVGDCCPDAEEECAISPAGCGCDGSCGGEAPGGCFCDCLCVSIGDCCNDAEELCVLSTTCAACCFPDGTCIDGLSQDECESGGGVYQGDGTSCDLGVCPEPTGACCLTTGCSDGGAQAECEANSGAYQGDGTICSEVMCPSPPAGACCYPKGCLQQSEGDCAGVFLGDGTSCETLGICDGACCLAEEPTVAGIGPGPVCVVLGEFACASFANDPSAFQGPGTGCEPNPCPQPTGACCTDEVKGTFCLETTESDCEEGDGAYQGDFTHCYENTCAPKGACCSPLINYQIAQGPGKEVTSCIEVTEATCESGYSGDYQGDYTTCEESNCDPERVDISKKGSLLMFSDVELEWTGSLIAGGGGFNLTKDTVISLINDYPADVYVQMYFVNGDPELDPLFAGIPPTLVREGEPGCNWVDCQVLLTPDQPVYWSAATGNPLGCQPFGILDPDLGNGPGRPNPDGLGGPRVLRGYIIAWAVDASGAEINWNHLSGKATIVDYTAQAAWEYGAWAFQALFGVHGDPLPSGSSGPDLSLNGSEYDNAFDMLLFDFFAAGSAALSIGGNPVSVDTDLTLHPVSADLRQETNGPITTKAHFDIWNMNERKLSNTRRCITCWDQSLLSIFNAPNTFLLANLQSDKGKARIDGKQADECEENCFRNEVGNPLPIEDLLELLGDLFNDVEVVCSRDAAILGVAAKILRFGNNSIDYAGSELVGMGTQGTLILYDVVDPPGSLRDEAFERIERSEIQTKKAPRLGQQNPR